jgi:hypothetical protein
VQFAPSTSSVVRIMSAARPVKLICLTALASLGLAGPLAGHGARASDPSSNFARARAESERKSKEIKKAVEDHRKEVEAHQRAVRERLKLPDRSGAAPLPSAAKSPATSLPDAEALLKKWNLPDPRSSAKSTGRSSTPGMTKNAVEYKAKRGDEFAFLVEISAREDGLYKQWVGTPYFAGIYSDVGRSFAEMFCIGSLACRIRSSADRPWTAASVDDIEFPQRWMMGSTGVSGAQTTSLFDQPTLPLSMSAILPLEERVGWDGIDEFSANLKEAIRDLPSKDYIEGRHFLDSLAEWAREEGEGEHTRHPT